MKKKLFYSSLITMVAVAPVTYAAETNFSDVAPGHWAYHEILNLKEKGLIYGYTESLFKPSVNITRAQVTALLSRSLDPAPKRASVDFKDVPKGTAQYEDIQKIYRAGIMDGKGKDKFDPNGLLTRVEMAKVLTLAFNLQEGHEAPFSDISPSHWGYGYVATLYTHGITLGSNGKYNPNDHVSRAHYAVFLDRALNKENQAPSQGQYTERRTAIQNEWQKKMPKYNGAIQSESSSVMTPYQPGKVHPSALTDALNMTNFIRYLTGLPSTVRLNESFNQEAQAAALLNAINQDISHAPKKPTAMDNTLFNLGYNGAQTSNIGYGYPTITNSLLEGYMSDASERNRIDVGHRRWILSPRLKEVGFGFVKDRANTPYTAMKVVAPDLWNNVPASYSTIAWPAPVAFPTDFFGHNDPWSVSLNEEIYDDARVNEIVVHLTRKSDGNKWTFSKSDQSSGFFNIDTNDFGYAPFTIIFQPKGISAYKQNDHYKVEIHNVYRKNGQKTTINYETTFFDL